MAPLNLYDSISLSKNFILNLILKSYFFSKPSWKNDADIDHVNLTNAVITYLIQVDFYLKKIKIRGD